MPTEVLSIGPLITLVQNQVYASPAVKVTVYSDHAAPALEQSSVTNFATKSTVTLTGGQGTISAPFLRTTGSGVAIRLVRD